jgi:hypothetical protein
MFSWVAKFTRLKGLLGFFGVTGLISVASASFKNPELIFKRTEEYTKGTFYLAYGFSKGVFDGTASAVTSVGTSVGTGVSTLSKSAWDLLFGDTVKVSAEDVGDLIPPIPKTYSFWDWLTFPRKVISDSYFEYVQ